tara:strand:- start:359 stop:652 length:294 start_codon:yes stop_codon:yes gene_type:complete
MFFYLTMTEHVMGAHIMSIVDVISGGSLQKRKNLESVVNQNSGCQCRPYRALGLCLAVGTVIIGGGITMIFLGGGTLPPSRFVLVVVFLPVVRRVWV